MENQKITRVSLLPSKKNVIDSIPKAKKASYRTSFLCSNSDVSFILQSISPH